MTFFFSKKKVFLHHFPPKSSTPSDFKKGCLITTIANVLAPYTGASSKFVEFVISLNNNFCWLRRWVDPCSFKCKCLIKCLLVLIKSFATNLRCCKFKTVIFTKLNPRKSRSSNMLFFLSLIRRPLWFFSDNYFNYTSSNDYTSLVSFSWNNPQLQCLLLFYES